MVLDASGVATYPVGGYYGISGNAAIVNGPVDVTVTLIRNENFPADEATTVTLPLPNENSAAHVDKTLSFWNGDLQFTKLVNQYHSRTSPDELSDLPGSTDLQIRGTAHSEARYVPKRICLTNATGSKELQIGAYWSSHGPGEIIADFEFNGSISWLNQNGQDASDYTSVTLYMASPRTLDFHFIIEPELATIPAEVYSAEVNNVFSGNS